MDCPPIIDKEAWKHYWGRYRQFSGILDATVLVSISFLRLPELLLLDEPTNHLDPTSATQLMRNPKPSNHSPAIVLISHEREIVRQADLVYEMKHGHVIQSEMACA